MYPGSPEPLTFDEPEPRGPVWSSVAGDGSLAYEALDDNRWSRAATLTPRGRALGDVVDAACAAATVACAGLDADHTMLRVDLVGEIDQASDR